MDTYNHRELRVARQGKHNFSHHLSCRAAFRYSLPVLKIYVRNVYIGMAVSYQSMESRTKISLT